MESGLLPSVIGIITFFIIIVFGFRYSNGKFKMPKSKEDHYKEWSIKHGKKVRKSLLILSILFIILMTIQLLNLSTGK